MSLKNEIQLLEDVLSKRSTERAATHLSSALRVLGEQVNDAGTVAIEDINEFVTRCISTLTHESTQERFTQRDKRGIARYLFHKRPDEKKILADFDSVHQLVASELARSPSPAFIRCLMQSFLFGYGQNHPYLARLAEDLKQIPADQQNGLTYHAIALDFLDPKTGHEALSRTIASQSGLPRNTLSQLGFTADLEFSTFTEAAFAHFCDKAARDSPTKEKVDALLDWALLSTATSDQGGLNPANERYGRRRVNFINALLLPWSDSIEEPPSTLESKIRNLLLESLGDPRFLGSAASWEGVDPKARDVLIHWLNAASLRQFFDIVTDTMTSSDGKRMWRYRRKFWTAYLPYINHAWVVFAQEGERLALRRAANTGDKSFRQFARFSLAGVSSEHAVLLLKIGDTTIAEWSHNGKCRIWSKGASTKPTLYERNYNPYDLRNGEWDQAHTGNETYGWQQKIAAEIRARTGVKIQQKDYYVGRDGGRR